MRDGTILYRQFQGVAHVYNLPSYPVRVEGTDILVGPHERQSRHVRQQRRVAQATALSNGGAGWHARQLSSHIG